MRIVLVGAGNLATNLGRTLKQSGENIIQLYSHTEKSASKLGTELNIPYTTNILDLSKDAELYIVSLKDSVLQKFLPLLVEGREKALFVHTAGSVPLSIWNGIAQRGGVFYPMQTFSKNRNVDFRRIPCFIEACNKKDEKVLCGLAGKLSQKVVVLDSEKRKYLHLAAVFACNFTNHMYNITAQILEHHGIPFNVMLSLIDETAAKVHELSPINAQTGPAVRYDEDVMNRQIALLAENPEWQDLYKRISNNIHYDQLRIKKN